MWILLLACETPDKPLDTVDSAAPVEDSAADTDTDTRDTSSDCVAEVCDGVDNDCDGSVDEDTGDVYYADTDGDGYGDPAVPARWCDAPAGWATDRTDCDDTDRDAHPDAEERANGADDDCDGDVDEGVDAPFEVTVRWDDDGATFTIVGAAARYELGMAETGVGEVGWFGESCIPGDEPYGYPDYGFDVCHSLGASGGRLSHVDGVDDVDDGATLMSDDIAAARDITYFLADPASSDCWVWGDQPAYYASFGCTEVP